MSKTFNSGIFECCSQPGDVIYACCCFPCFQKGLATEMGICSVGQSGQGLLAACICSACFSIYMRYQGVKKAEVEESIIETIGYGWCCACCSGVQLQKHFHANPVPEGQAQMTMGITIGGDKPDNP